MICDGTACRVASNVHFQFHKGGNMQFRNSTATSLVAALAFALGTIHLDVQAQQFGADSNAQSTTLSNLVAPAPKSASVSKARVAVRTNADGKRFQFTTNDQGQLVSTKRIGGLEVQYRYKDESQRNPSMVRIGNRRWVEVTPDMKCNTTKSAITGSEASAQVQQSDGVGYTADTGSSEGNHGQAINRKWQPGDDYYISQQEIDDMQAMIDLQYAYVLEYYQLGPREDCLFGCEVAYDISQVLCAGMGIFNPAAGFLCLAIATAGKYACRAGCSIYP